MDSKIGEGEEPPSMMKDQVEDTDGQRAANSLCPFEVLFEQAAIGIAQVALNGQLLHVNQYLCDITGYPQEELVQRTLLDRIPQDERSALWAFFQECINGKAHGKSVEMRTIR